MEKYSSDDMFIPVMPRILDPSLKLNGKSLMKSMEITESRFKENKESDNNKTLSNCDPRDHVIDVAECNKKKELVISSKYKYYALIFVSILVFIVLIYFIYKYFSKKKQDENKTPTETDSSEGKNKQSNEEKDKTEADAKKYISEYIDIISDTDSEIDNVKEETTDFRNNNLEIIKEEQYIPEKKLNVGVVSFENLEINTKSWDTDSVSSSKGTVIEYIEDNNTDEKDALFENASSEYSNDDDDKENEKNKEYTMDDNNKPEESADRDGDEDVDSLQYFNKYK